LKGKDNLEDLGTDGKGNTIKMDFKYGVRIWTGFIWLRITSSDELS
jgi:hypothetical protein